MISKSVGIRKIESMYKCVNLVAIQSLGGPGFFSGESLVCHGNTTSELLNVVGQQNQPLEHSKSDSVVGDCLVEPQIPFSLLFKQTNK